MAAAPPCSRRKSPASADAEYIPAKRSKSQLPKALQHKAAAKKAASRAKSTTGVCTVGPSEDPKLQPVVFHHPRIPPRAADEDVLRAQVQSEFVHTLRAPVLRIHGGRAEVKRHLLQPAKGEHDLLASVCSLAELARQLRPTDTIVVHYKYDPKKPLTSAMRIEDSDLQFVFEAYQSKNKGGKNPNRLRCDLYVAHAMWSCLDAAERERLTLLLAIAEAQVFLTCSDRRPSYSRDAFAVELMAHITEVERDGCRCLQKEWYFPPGFVPLGYDRSRHAGVAPARPSFGLPVGVTTYEDFVDQKELEAMEKQVNALIYVARHRGHKKAVRRANTVQASSRGSRYKFFYNARYIWGANVEKLIRTDPAAGVRTDVDPMPAWLPPLLIEPLVKAGIVPSAEFVNAVAINVYVDGTLGLSSHVDNAERFCRPIITLRLFSGSRLCFGAKGQGMNDPMFFIPMPRGCITVLEESGFAADEIKHCIRSADMEEKSASIILRRIHPKVLSKADEMED